MRWLWPQCGFSPACAPDSSAGASSWRRGGEAASGAPAASIRRRRPAAVVGCSCLPREYESRSGSAAGIRSACSQPAPLQPLVHGFKGATAFDVKRGKLAEVVAPSVDGPHADLVPLSRLSSRLAAAAGRTHRQSLAPAQSRSMSSPGRPVRRAREGGGNPPSSRPACGSCRRASSTRSGARPAGSGGRASRVPCARVWPAGSSRHELAEPRQAALGVTIGVTATGELKSTKDSCGLAPNVGLTPAHFRAACDRRGLT